MILKLVIPAELGEGVEVRLLLWSKSEGEPVAPDEALLEFETDKAIVLVCATQAGTLRKCFFAAGDWMKPGDTAAWLSDDSTEPLPSGDDAALQPLPLTFEAT